jgi:WD40 repeat protein/transcriptional regulator with XRE-family HTH domain
MKRERQKISKLRTLRLERNLTQEQLAEQIGTTKVNVSRWERGEIVPGLYYRQKLCELFGKSPYELGFLVEEETPSSEGALSGDHQLQQTVAAIPSSASSFTEDHHSPASPTPQTGQRSLPAWSKERGIILIVVVIVILGGSVVSLNHSPASFLPAGRLFYTFSAPQRADVFNVELSSDGNHLVGVIGNGTAQLMATRKGAYFPVTTIRAVNVATWSPDDTRIATANADDTVRIWNSADGIPLSLYNGPADVVSGLSWSPDGKYLAAGDGNGVLWIWNAQTNTLVYSAHIHTDRIWWVAWSPDGKRIATASDDKTVQIWDLDTQATILTYTGHTKGVLEVTWSPDGKYLASSSRDATARVWDATTGKTVTVYHGHTDQVTAAVWSSDGKRIASSSYDGTVQIWNALTGQTILTYKGHTRKVWAVSWSKDNRIASASADGTLQVWQAP